MNYVFLTVFCLAAGFLAMLAKRAKDQMLPFHGPISLPGKAVRVSEKGWNYGHLCAWPYLACAAALCLIQALAIYVSFFFSASSYAVGIAVIGIILVVLVWILAAVTANRAARHLNSPSGPQSKRPKTGKN